MLRDIFCLSRPEIHKITLLTITSSIFVAQKAITYRWNRNFLTYHLILKNHRFNKCKCYKNSKHRKIAKSKHFLKTSFNWQTTSSIFVAQKTITYRWNRYFLSYHLIVRNHRFNKCKCYKNSKHRQIAKSNFLKRILQIGRDTGFWRISRSARGCESLLQSSVVIYHRTSADYRICTR